MLAVLCADMSGLSGGVKLPAGHRLVVLVHQKLSTIAAAAIGELGRRRFKLGYQMFHRVLVHQNKRLNGKTTENVKA